MRPHQTEINVEDLEYESPSGKRTVREFLQLLNNDAILVMLDGSIIYERYKKGARHTPHALTSMSSALVGLLATMSVNGGKLDVNKTVDQYLDDFSNTPYGSIRIGDVLSMRVPIEHTADTSSPLDTHPMSIREALKTTKIAGSAGSVFQYEDTNVEIIGLILAKLYKHNLSELLSQVLWMKIGAEEDASWSIDADGAEVASNGLAATARDIARIGEMMRLGGALKGVRIISPKPIHDLRIEMDFDSQQLISDSNWGGAIRNYGFHNFWFIPPRADHLHAVGRHGQHLYVAPNSGLTVVLTSSSDSDYQTYGGEFELMMEWVLFRLGTT
jgi:CubicO group peptidase (beta-lactamase class C family)